MIKDFTIENLMNLDETIAKELFEGKRNCHIDCLANEI